LIEIKDTSFGVRDVLRKSHAFPSLKENRTNGSGIMEILLILIYVSICVAVFKLFRIPVNQWSLSTAALGGIFGITLLLLTMNYNHPFTTNARIYFPVTPILPTLKGRVIEVPVHANTPLKEGDVLFKIDPKPYQYVVDEKKAALAEADQNVKQLKASFDQASAQAERANAQLQLAQQNYDRQAQLFKTNVVAQATLDTATRNLDASKQSLAAAKAEEERAHLAYTSEIGGVHTTVAKLRAELADAEFDLDQTTTRALGPGFVTQVSLRPGMYAIPVQLRTAMLFVNTGNRDRELAAAIRQNSLQRVTAGDEAEVAFDAVPGRVFQAKVRSVVDAIATGQLGTTPRLIEPESLTIGGRALVILDVSDEMNNYQIPLGSTAQAAIYTKHWHHLSLLRKILLRMRSWENYFFLEGHGGAGGSGGHH
jgi:multidrug resistance efflux pump